MSFSTSPDLPTPQRWRGLSEPTIGRPQAAQRMPGLDALDYSQMRIPKSSNAYVIPPLRNEFSTSPAFAEPRLKRAKPNEPQETSNGVVKRPRSMQQESFVGSPSPLEPDLEPELKKGRFNEETYDATDSADASSVSSVASSRESDVDSNVQEETATNDMAVDSTNTTFASLVFNRLKELCKKHSITIPKGAKKVDCVSLLSEKYPAPRPILEEESFSSFTKEALEEKCRFHEISDNGSKAKLIERLEAFSVDV